MPVLSIIVPIFNEAEQLPALFQMLTAQQGVDFELIVCDGGSTDASPQIFPSLASLAPFPCRWLDCPAGRGRQMNAAALASLGTFLLFLHCDSSFTSPNLLMSALAEIQILQAESPQGRVAGHFGLCFVRSSGHPSLGYFFYECKSHLNLAGCIHGDQGFLLSRKFFEEVGRFDESLPFLEDDRLAQSVREVGDWITLPGELATSARRFETEGLFQRQLLNALILNFLAVGWDTFLADLPQVYRLQHATGKLALLPIFRAIHKFLRGMPARQCWGGLWRTGGFVRDNGWQINLWLWVRNRYRKGLLPDAPDDRLVETWLRNWERFSGNRVAQLVSMLLTLASFYGLFLILLMTEKKE